MIAYSLSLDKEIDTPACESDIIWKYMDDAYFNSNFFLDFPVAKSRRKVAYAPSLSAHAFTENQKKIFVDLVLPFYSISFREE